MNPQYLQQSTQQQFNSPPPNSYGTYGVSSSVHSTNSSQQQFRGSSQNTLAQPQIFPGSIQQTQVSTTGGQIPPSTLNVSQQLLQSQMAGMNINGQRIQSQQNSFPTGALKMPSSFPPVINGGSPPDLISPNQQFTSMQQLNTRPLASTLQSQFINGAPSTVEAKTGVSDVGKCDQSGSESGFTSQINTGSRFPLQTTFGQGFPSQSNLSQMNIASNGAGNAVQQSLSSGILPPTNLGSVFPSVSNNNLHNFPKQANIGSGFPPQPNSRQGLPPQHLSGYPPLPQQVYPPPQPNQPPGLYNQPGQYPQQQARKLDPDQMPSPVS
uniref:Uncharacterized protein n=1 Tax=Clastoptera arizonana TaxID=38151 RepID=A0A1B6D0G6_9HEMI